MKNTRMPAWFARGGSWARGGLGLVIAVLLSACGGGGGDNNVAPVADAGNPVTAREGELVTLVGSGSDSDGSIVDFDWSQVGGGPSVDLLQPAGSSTAEFVVPDIESDAVVTFELTVSDDDGASSSDQVEVTLRANFDIAGVITAAQGIANDSDVNDQAAPLQPNNDFDTAQPVGNPVLLGGFANQPGSGEPAGQLTQSGDVFDVYAINAVAGQRVSLFIEAQRTAINDLDLVLFDASGALVDASLSISSFEEITIPQDGQYFVRVEAFSGSSNYVLRAGQSVSSASTARPGQLLLSHDFLPGEAIVRFDESKLAAQGGFQAMAQATGLSALGGGAERSRLVGLSNYALSPQFAARATRFKALAVGGDPALAERLNTLLAIKALQRRDDVVHASPNYRRTINVVPADEFVGLQWHYPAISLPAAWDLSQGSAGVIVGVIDTGVLLDHPDFAGKLTPGYDFISSAFNANDGDGIDPNPNDPGDLINGGSSSFHGTHVAGTVGAATDNTTGVAGAGWNVRIMPLRALGRQGGSEFDITQAVRYAAGLANDSGTVPAEPADIINLSLGGPGFSQSSQDLYNQVRAEGVIVVAAAGNSSTDVPSFPAAYDGVISVSAVDINQRLASYSNFGSTIDLAAPGGSTNTDVNGDGFGDGVLSAIGDDSGPGATQFTYAFLQGTSMAAPHVAGVVALMRSVFPGLSPSQLDSLIVAGAISDDLGASGRDDLFGHGLINAFAAVVTALDASGGDLPGPTPVLIATPAALNFGVTLDTQTITVSNGGTGDLVVDSVAIEPAVGWLSVSAQGTDVNGVGTYQVRVDRSGLDIGTFQANVLLDSNGGGITVPVIMQVSSGGTGAGNAGNQFILLIEAASGQVIRQATPGVVVDSVPYGFDDVPPGTYVIIGGTDMDEDGFVCDAAEACGAYPVLDPLSLQTVTIDAARDDLDFGSTYNGELASQGAAASSQDFVAPTAVEIMQSVIGRQGIPYRLGANVMRQYPGSLDEREVGQ